jgi:UDP-GlcNAc:undecaprenyl-phosphate GlcNAc-1-phosphate transferase
MALGLSHYEAVLVIYGVQAALVSAVYLLRHESDALVMGTFVLFGAGVVTLLHLAAVRGWRFGGGAGQGTWLDRALDRVRGLGLPAATGLWLLRFTLPVALIVGPLLVARVPPDVGLVAWVALGLALLGMRLGERAYLLSLGVYLDAALVAYVLETSSGLPESYWLSIDIFFTLMAVALGLLLRFSSFRSFRLNPLDFLLVFLALLVPPVLHRIDPEVAVGGFMLKFVVLCYAAEVLLSRTRADRTILASGVLAGTLLLGLRGLP